MTTRQQVALLRVLSFYLTALVLLLFAGGALQFTFGLAGVVATQLLIFVTLPLLFTRLVEKRPARPFLRLRMLTLRGFGRAVLLGVVGWLAAQLMGAVLVLLVHLLGGEMIPDLPDPPGRRVRRWPCWSAPWCPPSARSSPSGATCSGPCAHWVPTAAVVLTGLLFGALHLSIVRLIPLTVLGMLWALAVQRSGSILPGMIMHLINNGIALPADIFRAGSRKSCRTAGPRDPSRCSRLDVDRHADPRWPPRSSAAPTSWPPDSAPAIWPAPRRSTVEWDWQAEGQAEPGPVAEGLAAEGDAELQRLAAELAALAAAPPPHAARGLAAHRRVDAGHLPVGRHAGAGGGVRLNPGAGRFREAVPPRPAARTAGRHRPSGAPRAAAASGVAQSYASCSWERRMGCPSSRQRNTPT